MPRTTVYIVSDDAEAVEKAHAYFGPTGVQVTSYGCNQWKDGLEQSQFRAQLVSGVQGSGAGGGSGGNILIFPVQGESSAQAFDPKMPTMDELESKAIESAIAQFRGNLTEAAKALGIGRATLYRKVKQYHIDPTLARRKRAA